MPNPESESRWLLLIHRVPPKPGYVRVKIWRRLQGVGAVAVKNSVYALPRSDQSHEDFKWIAQEVQRSGGEATICEAAFLDGMTDGDLQRLFNEARDAEYQAVADDVSAEIASLPAAPLLDPAPRSALEADVLRFRRRLSSIAKIDYFGARGRQSADSALTRLEHRLRDAEPPQPAAIDAAAYRGRVWVTRKGIHVDRIASAWLIRRFIDPGAVFRFVVEREHPRSEGEIRFDMFNGEFTHEGDLCTFEVLLARFKLADKALAAIGEIIHDIDLKESKFARPETAGFERLITGIAASHKDDLERLERGSAFLDDLYEAFRRYSR